MQWAFVQFPILPPFPYLRLLIVSVIISAYPGGYYALVSGTSFSAPLVSGEAALSKSLQRGDAEKAISKGTVNIDSLNPGYQHKLGFGRIDMLRAVQSAN